MKEQCIVEKIENDFAYVKLIKKDECAKCGMCLFPKNAKSMEMKAKNTANASIGDVVIFETSDKAKTISYLLVFFIPLILICIAGVIGYFALHSELWILLLSLIFLVSWYTIIAVIDKKIQKNTFFCPEITMIVTKGEKNDENRGNSR